MTGLLLIVLMQLAWTYGQQQGQGSFAYTDSTGKRFSGTYGVQDGKVVQSSGDLPVAFADSALPGSLWNRAGWPQRNQPFRRAFQPNIESQRLAFDAARKAFDLSTNQADRSYFPNFASRFQRPPFGDFGIMSRFGGFPNFPNFEMPNYGNSAFAGAAAGPGYRRQIAAISPMNPNLPNINRISHFSDSPGSPKYYSVSSKSYSSSANLNGQETNRRGAETVVNDNGRVTQYKVEN